MRRLRRSLLLAAPLLLASCELPDFGAPDPATEEGESVLSLYQGYIIAAAGVGLLVWGLLIYSFIRYRARHRTDIPHQREVNIPIEILYTVLPLGMVAALFGFSVAAEGDVTDVSDDPDLTVEVLGFQWQWQFTYQGDDGEPVAVVIGDDPGEPPELVLPVGQTTRLDLVAHDVNHAFWVPSFLTKKDLIPGLDNAIQVTPTRTGSYDGVCAEYCGLEHWRMRFSVRIVEADEFDDWLADQS